MPQIELNRPLRVEPTGGSELKIINRGLFNVFYGQTSSVSAAEKMGTLAVGESLTLTRGLVWLVAERTPVTIDLEENEIAPANTEVGQEVLAEFRTLSEELHALIAAVEALEQSVVISGAPIVTTEAIAAGGTPTAVKLKGHVNPNNRETQWFFEYGPTAALGKTTAITTVTTELTTNKAVEAEVKSSEAGEEFTSAWFYRLFAQNAVKSVQGSTVQLGELKTPTARIANATKVTAAEATFNGFVSANESATTVKFKYGKTSPPTEAEVTANEVGAAEAGLVPVTATLKTALSGTYFFRIVAKNAKGETVESAIETFSVAGATGALLVGNESAALTNEDQTKVGFIEAFRFVASSSGTIEELQFRTNNKANTGVTSLVLGVYTDAEGKPGTVLGQGTATGEETGIIKKEAWIKVTGLAIKLTSGTPYWLAELPLGTAGKLLHFNCAKEGVGDLQSTAGGFAKLEAVSELTAFNEGPVGFAAFGKVEAPVEQPPVLKVGTDKQTVEWAGTAPEWSVAISNAPQSVTGRTTAYVTQAHTVEPQKFKPEAKKTYGNAGATQFTPKEGETVYVGVKEAGEHPWSAEVSVTIPGAAVSPTQVIGVYAGSGQTTGIFKRMNEAGIRYYRPGTDSARTEEYIRVAAEQKVTIGAAIFFGKTAEKLSNINTFNEEIINFFKKYGVGGSFWSGKAFAERPVRAFEIFNEPGLSGETTNYKGYGEIIKKCKEALEVAFPSTTNRPLLLANVESGGGSLKFGEEVEKAVTGALTVYADGLISHPYGGSNGQYSTLPSFPWAKKGIESVHTKWNKNVYVTELGWPIEKSTSDSQGWTSTQQAENIKKFAVWMKEPAQSYIKMYLHYADFDESAERKYGLIEGKELNNTARPGWLELGKYSKEASGF